MNYDNWKIAAKSTRTGILGIVLLLATFFGVVSLISGWSFALSQFYAFWYFIVSLALGFGIQVGLYAYLKRSIQTPAGPDKKILAVSGTTSTAAMISCCAHYLTNILPIIGTAGIIGLIGQYQVEFFWLGLIFNLAGIVYIAGKVIKFHPRYS